MGWYEFLPQLLNMSMTASLIILAVLVVRLLLKKAPRVFSYALWAVVLFRLLCPVSVASDFSLLGAFQVPVEDGAAEFIPVDVVHTEYPRVTLPSLNWGIVGDHPEVQQAEGIGEISATNTALEAPISIATYIWGLGVLLLVIYNLVQLWKLREKLQIAEPLKDNVYLADHIDTAFVMGLVRPKIYLPSGLKEQERGYIILHEQYHIRRGDHVVKVLAFAALCIHWFNPLVWLAFLLANKDMEMSCDEAVMKQMEQDIRAEYAQSLLQFATGKRLIAGAPLAFGEGDTKARVKNVMHYKKPAFWLVLVAVVVCVVAVVCLVTNPREENSQPLPVGKTFGCALRTYNGTSTYFNPEGELFFCITKDGHLMGKGMLHPALETIDWVDLGLLEEVKLTAKNYDYYFQTGSPYEKYEIDRIMQGATIRYRVKKAWQVIGDEEDLLAWNYYLLYLENGTWGMVCWDANGESGAVKWMVDLEEIEQEPVDVQVGMTYRTMDCRYMNPASSFLAIGGDNGYLYRIEEDAFVEVSKASGVETRIEIAQWVWQEFPYTDEEWAALFIPFTQGHENISQYYTEMLYQPLNNRKCLLKMDGQLWLVDITNGPKAEKYIWSIYSLTPLQAEASGAEIPFGQETVSVCTADGETVQVKLDIELVNSLFQKDEIRGTITIRDITYTSVKDIYGDKWEGDSFVFQQDRGGYALDNHENQVFLELYDEFDAFTLHVVNKGGEEQCTYYGPAETVEEVKALCEKYLK